MKNIISILKNPTKIYLKNMNKLKYKHYGVINHGTLLNNNEFDIIIPGYTNKINSTYVYSKDIIGILWVSDGNHKIFINIEHDGFNYNKCNDDSKKFINEYLNIHKSLNGYWIEPIMALN